MLTGLNLIRKFDIFSTPTAEIEHRTSHHADHAVLNVFETCKITRRFDLTFDNPVVVSMIQGKKVMNLRNKNQFDFLPGQTIVMPASELMYIDFPEASSEIPTQCMALEISSGFVKGTLDWLNEYYPRIDNEKWTWTKDNFLLLNNAAIQNNMNHLIRVLVENNLGRQMVASNTTRELILSLLQTQARFFLLENIDKLSTRNRLAHVIKYIRKHLYRPININELLNEACLSRAQFFRLFHKEMGESPVQFINRERLQIAKQKMINEGLSITEACFESGYSSINYFSRIFKQLEGKTPSDWRMSQTVIPT
jgi:AraC-like DNA-binding protein